MQIGVRSYTVRDYCRNEKDLGLRICCGKQDTCKHRRNRRETAKKQSNTLTFAGRLATIRLTS